MAKYRIRRRVVLVFSVVTSLVRQSLSLADTEQQQSFYLPAKLTELLSLFVSYRHQPPHLLGRSQLPLLSSLVCRNCKFKHREVNIQLLLPVTILSHPEASCLKCRQFGRSEARFKKLSLHFSGNHNHGFSWIEFGNIKNALTLLEGKIWKCKKPI